MKYRTKQNRLKFALLYFFYKYLLRLKNLHRAFYLNFVGSIYIQVYSNNTFVILFNFASITQFQDPILSKRSQSLRSKFPRHANTTFSYCTISINV